MNPTLQVFRKEIREMLRDKRVVNNAIFGPVFLIVLMIALFGFMHKTLGEKKAVKVAISTQNRSQQFMTILEASNGFKITDTPSMQEAEALLSSGKVKLAVEFEEGFDARIARGEAAKVTATYDPGEPTSEIALRALSKFVEMQNRVKVEATLVSKGLNKDLVEPIRLVEREAAGKEPLAASFLVSLLPYLIVIWAFYGGFSIVSDLVAGEKERLTLETLLITPATRTQIAMGKFWALATVCLTSSLTSLLTVLVVGAVNLPMTRDLFPQGVSISLVSLLAILATLIPLVFVFAGVLLMASAHARNSREAQTYLTLISFVVLMPAIFSQIIGLTDFAQARWVSFVPVLNTATNIRSALLGKIDVVSLLITAGVGVFLALIAIKLVVAMFNREQVLVRI